DLSEVDREHRHTGPGIRPQCTEDRSVAAQRKADVDILGHRGVQLQTGRRLQPVLLGLGLVEAQDRAELVRQSEEHLDRRRCLVRPAVREQGGPGYRVHGSTSRAAVSRSSTPPPRPASANHTNVSRFPFGPGSSELAYPSTLTQIERAASPTATSAERRAAASRTTPPLPTASRPTSNCGLIRARQSNSGEVQASTEGSTFASEMNETSMTTRF